MVKGKILTDLNYIEDHELEKDYFDTERKIYKDYTPNQTVDIIKDRTSTIISKIVLHKILRMQKLIDDDKNPVTEEYKKYFYTKEVEVKEGIYSTVILANKLFITEEGIEFICNNIAEWLKEYKKNPKAGVRGVELRKPTTFD